VLNLSDIIFLQTAPHIKDKKMCLLCNFLITTVKKYNANQHYANHKNHKYVALDGEARQETLKMMKLQN